VYALVPASPKGEAKGRCNMAFTAIEMKGFTTMNETPYGSLCEGAVERSETEGETVYAAAQKILSPSAPVCELGQLPRQREP